MKKGIVLGIVFLFVVVSIAPISGIQLDKNIIIPSVRGDILYVGGIGPDNYTTIQSAVDDANDGDTVFVYNDSSPYYENVQINKSISLIGEDRNTTAIDANGKGDVIFITSDYVNINEFTINYSGWACSGIDIDIGFGFCTISNNIITNNSRGIHTWSSCNNTIEGNIFFDNKERSIMLTHASNNNTVSSNTIDHSDITNRIGGIDVGYWSTGNKISRNTVKNHMGYGISIWESEYNLVLNNVISSNDEMGIRIGESSNNSIIGNTISNNGYGQYGKSGIYIRDSHSKNNIIYHNNFISNNMNAVDLGNNTWDNGEHGNYWSDYRFNYPNAKRIWPKGIWDTPYEIPPGRNYDRYPLINEWKNSLSVTMQKNKVIQNTMVLWFLQQYPLLNLLLQRLRI